MMSNVKKRLSYVDMVRGIALLAVVLYHLATVDAVKTVCNHLIDSVLILFFFYSGYFFRPGKRTFVEEVKHRAKSLLFPLIQYGLCFWAVGTVYLLGTGVPIREALLCLRNFLPAAFGIVRSRAGFSGSITPWGNDICSSRISGSLSPCSSQAACFI